MKHTLIISPRDCWKHDFIRRVVAASGRPVMGYETQRRYDITLSNLGNPIYIHPFGGVHHFSNDNLVGYCINHKPHTVPGVFNRFAPLLMQPVPKDGILAFDEIGFLEAQEQTFCDAILTRLDGDIPVIATMKDKEIPFLMQVRNHPNCRCFYLTRDNHDALFEDVMEYLCV